MEQEDTLCLLKRAYAFNLRYVRDYLRHHGPVRGMSEWQDVSDWGSSMWADRLRLHCSAQTHPCGELRRSALSMQQPFGGEELADALCTGGFTAAEMTFTKRMVAARTPPSDGTLNRWWVKVGEDLEPAWLNGERGRDIVGGDALKAIVCYALLHERYLCAHGDIAPFVIAMLRDGVISAAHAMALILTMWNLSGSSRMLDSNMRVDLGLLGAVAMGMGARILPPGAAAAPSRCYTRTTSSCKTVQAFVEVAYDGAARVIQRHRRRYDEVQRTRKMAVLVVPRVVLALKRKLDEEEGAGQ